MTIDDLGLVRHLQEALDLLPDGKKEFFLGYAEGVIAMSQQQAAQQAAERG